jgi:hypothetical protein
VPASPAGDAPDEGEHLLLQSFKAQRNAVTLLGVLFQ